MAIFRCNKCGYLREVANEHIGKSAKCSQCQNVAGIHETTAFIEKIIEKYFTLQKELVNLREGTSSWDQLEIQAATPALNRSSFQFRHNRHLLASFSLANG